MIRFLFRLFRRSKPISDQERYMTILTMNESGQEFISVVRNGR